MNCKASFDSLAENAMPLWDHSHKKRKDSLEGSLDRVLFASELEFPKILAPRLPQQKSNVNIQYASKFIIVKTTVLFI